MKIAHFAKFAPNQSGQYGTVRDFIRAERAAGYDAEFVDYDGVSRIGLTDDWLTTVNMDFAREADFLIRHSVLPKKVERWRIPTVMALHGRPENSFLLEKYKTSPVITEVLKHRGPYITFWDELVYPWQKIIGEEIHLLTAPVDLERYKPEGFKHEFKPSGVPNIVVCDMWREDTTPFNVIMAAAYYIENYNKDARLHVYGLTESPVFDIIRKSKIFGEVYPQVQNLACVYRSADIVITPHVIATRVVREALASGCPIVAGQGNRYTPWTHDPRDTAGFAKTIKECWDARSEDLRKWFRKKAKMSFTLTPEELGRVFDALSRHL